jgi:hypothetical protein
MPSTDYNFDVDMWYILMEVKQASKLKAGLHLATSNEVEFFSNQNDWLERCEELDIEPETIE